MKTRFFLFSLSLFSLSLSVSALSYPTTPPPGEMTGGLYRSYFDNIFANYGSDCNTYGQVIGGFTSTGVPLCVNPVSSGLFLSGQTSGDTIRFDGTDWVRTNLIYNNATNIGIGMQTPAYMLDVAGTGNFLGLRMPTGAASGNVLVSDSSGNAYWAASFSGTYSASGITGGAQDYLPKYGTSGNGLVLSQFFDNGTSIGIGTATPSASVKMDIIGDILVNSLKVGRGGGNILSNIAFGWSALGVNVSGSMDSALGYGALSALTAGDGNIGLGNLAGSTLTSGNNNIFIGNNTQPNIGTTASNQLNIGNWIYGNAGDIGIGVTNPGAKLDISGQIKIQGGSPGTGKILVSSDASGLAVWQTGVPASSVDATNITGGVPNYITKFGSGGIGIFQSLFYEVGGYVGLGNTDPATILDITGQLRLRNGAGSGLVLVSNGSGVASWAANPPASTVSASGVVNGTQGYIPYFGTGGNGLFSSLMYQTGSRMAIGNTNPGYTLDVSGTGSFSGFRLPTGSSNGYILMSDASGNASWQAAAAGVSGGQTNYITRWLSSNTLGTGSITDNGTNVGIGVPVASYKLEVAGTGSFSGFRLPTGAANGRLLTTDASGNASWTGFIVANSLSITGSSLGNTLYYDGTNWTPSANISHTGGNVGIGTASPGAKLEVAGTVKITGGSPGLGKILTSDASGLATWSSGFSGSVTASGITGGSSGYLSVFGVGGNGLYSSLLFQSGGRIGIGNSIPNSTLDVTGTGEFDGFRMPTGAANGYILMSDTTGNAFWSATASGTTATGIIGGVANYITKFGTGGVGIYPSRLYDDGTNIGIGIASGLGANLHVSGSTLVTGDLTVQGKVITDTVVSRTVTNVSISGSLYPQSTTPLVYRDIGSSAQRWNNLYLSGQITIGGGSPGAGKLLISDANGLASWTGAISATSLNITGQGLGTTLFHNGTNWIATTNIFNTGADVGIGTSTPGAKLGVNGQVKITGGSPGLNKVLTSDAAGLATWSSVFNGSTTATGITGGTQNYVSKFGTGGNGLYVSQIYDNGTNVSIGTGVGLTAKFTIDSGINNVSGLRMPRVIASTPVFTGTAAPLGVDGSGNVVVAQQGAIPVYTALGSSPNAAIDTTVNPPTIGANYDRYFNINARQSFAVTDVTGNPYNCPEFEVGSINKKPTGCNQTPWATYIMTAQNQTTGNRYGYQILISDRTDAPFVVRGGTYYSATGKLMNTIGTVESLWFKAITVPTNRSDWFYINPGVDANSNPIAGGGYVGIGTQTMQSKFEIWSGSTTTSSMMHFRGNNNLGIGFGAVKTDLSGNANVGIGGEALFTIAGGYSNTAIGYRALKLTSGGFKNTAIGQEALNTNAAGSFNTAGGYQSLYSNSSGTGNTANGAESLYNLSTGNGNTALGFQAVRATSASSVSYNVGIGYQALYSTTASNLTAVGYQSLYLNSSGTGNTAIGYQAMDAVTTGSNNTGLGYNALGSATGSQNIGIGANAGSSLTSGSNNIIIGANKQVVTPTGSDQLNIGDWIYGNGGNIGIGTSSLTSGAKLEVAGTVKITGGSPGAGKVLTSDATGLASWQTPTGSGGGGGTGGVSGGVLNYTARWLGATSLGTGAIYDNGTDVSIGDATAGAKLDVNGTVKFGVNGTQLNAIIKATVNKDIASVASGGGCNLETFSVPNSLTTGSVIVSPQTALNNRLLIAYARVSVAGTVEVKFCNESTGNINMGAMDYYITVIQ